MLQVHNFPPARQAAKNDLQKPHEGRRLSHSKTPPADGGVLTAFGHRGAAKLTYVAAAELVHATAGIDDLCLPV